MREGKSHGGYDQGDTDQKERQGDHASTARAPHVNVEPVEHPTKFNSLGDGDGKKEPEVSEQHACECQSHRKERKYVFPELNTPEWVTAVSAVAATIVAFCALGVSIVSCSVTQSQLDEMRSSSTQADQLVAAATVQAGALKDMRDVAVGQFGAIQGQLEAAKRQQELTIIQVRANMRKDGIQVIPVYSANREKVGWNLNPRWANVGGTDAKEVRFWWALNRGQKEDRGGDCPTAHKTDLDGRTTVIPPGQGMVQGAIFLGLDDAISAQADGRAIFAQGRIQYRDIFPDTALHYYNWCVRIIPNDIERDTFSFFNVQEEKE